jgi:hypothetical protein
MQEHESHVRRAREELDRSYRAEGDWAASAHLRLAGLHLARARDEMVDAELGLDGPRALHALVSNAR